MSKVIYGQYDSQNYPLKRFYYKELPQRINNVLLGLSYMELAVFRGGLAFVFLLNEHKYLLKDLDMLAHESKKESILDALREADIVYVNKNTFGNSVITAFWKDDTEYFKLDILLCSEFPSGCKKVSNGKKVNVVSASYIWRNRIEKIAEKEIRKHDDKKTLNHYKVASELSKYLLYHKDEILTADIEIVDSKLLDLDKVLSGLISKNDLDDFLQLQMELVRGD